MDTALITVLVLLALADMAGRFFLAWLLWRIARGDLRAQDGFKRIFQFVGLSKLPEAPQDYPKF